MDLNHSKYVSKHLLWVLQFGYMPYYMGLRVPWIYMSHLLHFGHISNFLCAPRAEVRKMVFSCLRPELMLITGLKALDCFHAKA